MKSLLKSTRLLAGLSTTEVAHRLGVSQSSVVRLEQSEEAESITLASLRRAAEAMGSKLEYRLAPPRSKRRESYLGLPRSRGKISDRRASAVGDILRGEVVEQSASLSPSGRIEHACLLSDLAYELSECSKKRSSDR